MKISFIQSYLLEFKKKLLDRSWSRNFAFCLIHSIVITLLPKEFKDLMMKTVRQQDKMLVIKKRWMSRSCQSFMIFSGILKHFQVSSLHHDFSLEEKRDSEPFWGTSEKTAFSNRGKKVKCKWAEEGEH